MTKNQIEYWKNVETERTNRAQELENQRHNEKMESLKAAELKQNKTLRQKELNQNKLLASLSNQLRSQELMEQTRSNRARESENTSSRVQSGQIAYSQQRISQNVAGEQLHETRRANQAQESFRLTNLDEIKRSNLIKEQELYRSNIAQENLKAAQTSLDRQRIAEQARANRVNEGIRRTEVVTNLVGSLANVAARSLSSLKLLKGAIK